MNEYTEHNVYFVFIDLEKTGNYNGTLLRDLLTAIRNKVSTMYISCLICIDTCLLDTSFRRTTKSL